MRRREHLVARALTALGLAASLAYLTWRVGISTWGPWWLAVPTLLIEFVAVAGQHGAADPGFHVDEGALGPR